MSTRKLKSIKIISEPQTDSEENDEGDDVVGKVNLTRVKINSNKSVPKKNKLSSTGVLNQRLFEEEEEEEEEDDDDLELIKVPIIKKKKFIPNLPLFNHFEDDERTSSFLNTEEIKKQMATQKLQMASTTVGSPIFNHEQSISEKSESSENIHSISKGETGSFTYVSNELDGIDVTKSDRKEEIEPIIAPRTHILDDGRLPLSEKEILMQRKLEEMEIKHDMYQAQMDIGEEDLNEWGTGELNLVDLGGHSTHSTKFSMPNLTIIGDDETLQENINHLKLNIKSLSSQSAEIKEGINREEVKLIDLTEKYDKLVSEINSLVSK